MSLTATLTATVSTDAATSAALKSTGDATTPTTHGTGEIADSNDSTYIYFASGGTVEWCAGAYTDLPAALGISAVRVTHRQRRGVGSDPAETHKARPLVRISGTNYYGSYTTCSGSHTDVIYTWTLNPATSVAWTPAYVNAAQFGLEISSDAIGAPPSGPEGTRIIVQVDYDPLPAAIGITRHLFSKDQFLKSAPTSRLKFVGGPDLLALSILDVADVEHVAGPHAADAGWEDETWQRWPGAVHGITIDPNAFTVTLDLKGQRGLRCRMFDRAWSNKSSGVLGDGVGYFAYPSSSRSFSRASEATFTNAVGESETVPLNVPAYDAFGMQILPASGARAADEYSWSNNIDDNGRVWNAAQGTFQAEIRVTASGSDQTVAYCYHDASNWAWIYWDVANTRFVFEIRSAGTTYRAYKAQTITGTQTFQIGARWTGSNAENGDAAYTAAIFVDRVKGQDVVFVAAMTQANASTLWIGTKGGAGLSCLNGSIRKILSSQEVYTDTEMGRTI